MLSDIALLPVHLVFQSRIRRGLWACLLGLSLVSLPMPGLALIVEEVPNPKEKSGGWVSDTANLLSPKTEIDINRLVSNLEAKTGEEIAVVTVPETKPSASPKEFATSLFNHWGLGKKGLDNGVLLLISKADRRVEIETGYGYEPILTDAKVGKIISQNITPRFKQGDFDGGAFAGTQAVIQSLGLTPAQVQSNPQAAQDKRLLSFLLGLAALGFIALVIYIYKEMREDMIDDSEDEAKDQVLTRKRVPIPKYVSSDSDRASDIQSSQTTKQDETKSGSSDGRWRSPGSAYRPVGDHRRSSPNTSEQSNFLGTGYSSSELTAAATWAALESSSSDWDSDSNTRSESESTRSDSSSSDSGSSYSDSGSSSSSSYSDSSSSSSDFSGGSSCGGGAGDSW